jgi:phage terminase Nu1 subunit (DNA packaging protein)
MTPRKKKRIVHSQVEVADHFGVSITAVQNWFGAGAPNKPRRKGIPGEYDINAIDEWRREKKGLNDADPLLSGPDTPALEEYRKWKAKREKFAYFKDRAKWLPIDQVTAAIGVLSATLRQAFDALQRQFGPEALAIVSSAVDDAEGIFLRAIGKSDVDFNSDDSTIDDQPDTQTYPAILCSSMSSDAPAENADDS